MSEVCHFYEKTPRYPLICNTRNTQWDKKIQDLSFILDRWDFFESGNEDPALDTIIDSALAGSPYVRPSPKLTLRQLFAVWRTGHLVFDAYYDEIGAVIPDKVYMVGFGFGLTAAVFWGIVPSKKMIIISHSAPGWSVWDPYRMGIFKRAASAGFAIETPSNPKRLST
jgi:hypothetical protein